MENIIEQISSHLVGIGATIDHSIIPLVDKGLVVHDRDDQAAYKTAHKILREIEKSLEDIDQQIIDELDRFDSQAFTRSLEESLLSSHPDQS